MRERTRRAVGALAVACALFTAACGGGGKAGPAPTIPQQTKDQLTVDSSVLQLSDLPGTWNTNRPASTASDSLPSRDDVLTVADACFPTNEGITATTAREFLSGPTLGHVLVRGVVEAHADATSIAGKLAAFTDAGTSTCVQQVVQKVFGAGTAIGDLSITPSTVDGVGDERGGFLVSINLSNGGSGFTIGADVVFARAGRFRATCTVINFDSQPDHGLCAEGLKAMLRRAAV